MVTVMGATRHTGKKMMTRAFNEGRVKPLQGRTPENTTPTRFEGFAGELARAYAAA